MRAIRRFQVRPVLPEALQPLVELSRNLRWSWHAPTRALFEDLDPDIWRTSRGNPLQVLSSLSRERVDAALADEGFVRRVRELEADLHRYLNAPGYRAGAGFDGEQESAGTVAYFCAEYGLTAALPQYSGGLGILAGDHLKTASDMGVDLIGVGLFYDSGYFRQSLSAEGRQQETYPVVDPDDLPMTLLKEEDGRPVDITLPLPGGRTLHAQVYVVQVGRVPLLLLDSKVRANDEQARAVTDRLYGGSPDHRLRQEILLGMGGVKAVRAYCRITGTPQPLVYHANEGHACFLAVERLSELTTGRAPSTVGEDGAAPETMDFDTALEVVRAGSIFTTHTPVPAGIDRYERSLVAQYLGGDCERPGVPVERVLALGAEDYPGGNPKLFNMAVLGLRTSSRANGVSRLHGETSRGMFHQLWPGFETAEIPIGHVTNGVHDATWRADEISALMAQRFTEAQILDGSGWRLGDADGGVSDAQLWQMRGDARARLVAAVRRRVRASWRERGAADAKLGWTTKILREDALTIGFARRVPTYKRLTLMLSDPERFTRILTDPQRPVQIVVAGKSHPDDEAGVRLIQQLVRFADDPAVRERIVFLPDYDMELARELVPGCDVWLNNPLRPLEASGTSGMKCALNGGLNLSVLDGWWEEYASPHFGWAIPTAEGVTDPAERDALEAESFYDLLENTIVPMFYERSEDGVGHVWLDMVRATLADLAPEVSSRRMMTDYLTDLYLPTAHASLTLDAPGHEQAAELASWKQRMRGAWGEVRIDHVESGGAENARVGDMLDITVYVNLGTTITPKDVAVEVALGRVGEDDVIEEPSFVVLDLERNFNDERYSFGAQIPLEVAGPVGYAVRVVPEDDQVSGPTQIGLITLAQPTG